MSFCGGRGPDSSRYVATVSGRCSTTSSNLQKLTFDLDDKMLMVWDLHPTVDISSSLASPARSPDARNSASPPARPQPTAYVIAFPHPLTSICSHPTTSKEFLVSDSRGSIFLTDWRSDPEDVDATNWRHSSLVELVEPHALSTFVGLSGRSSARVGWRQDNRDMYISSQHSLGRLLNSCFSASVAYTGQDFLYGTSLTYVAEGPLLQAPAFQKEVTSFGGCMTAVLLVMIS